jgi:Sulfotransferase domain
MTVDRTQQPFVPDGTVTRPLDFVVIGAQKSGTTTLHHYLRHHPRIFLPPAKEVPFFMRDVTFQQGWDAFRADHFAEAPDDAVWGKVTPNYMIGPQVPERMARMMPRLKLIAILREPVDRCFSDYRMRVRSAIHESRAFTEVVDAELEERALASARIGGGEEIVVRGEYGRILETFLEWFPRDQLSVQFTDDLERDPERVVDSILTFVGLAPGWAPANLGKRYFVGGESKRLGRLKPTAARLPPVRAIWRRLPADRRRALNFWYKTEFTVKKGDATIPPGAAARLAEFYEQDRPRLERILGCQVPWSPGGCEA